ncbi:MAG TPA: hypothetical protein VIU37_09575 [Candidatus Limnocylindrales bacterium]
MTRPTAVCGVCTAVNPIDLIELDTLMGDPAAWPASVWKTPGFAWQVPKGDLPASYRRFGAVEMGVEWIRQHGYDEVDRRDVRRHYRFDVPKIAVTPDQLVATGLIARGNTSTNIARLNPLAYLDYYNTGIEVGLTGLQLIRDKIAALQAAGEQVPLALVKMAIDAGKSLAMSQASIKARGYPWGDEDDDDGFRAGSAPEASPRMGSHRVRVIDGEARPVRDRGPADRATYNERARQEGSPLLPER